MILLLLGLFLWVDAHLFKRLLPGPRAMLTQVLGDASKAVFAVILLGSVVLMVLGYSNAEIVPVYDPPSWGAHLNNLLMIFAIALFGLGSSKSRLRGKLRHPQLTGFITWGVAHLLVNGDLASIVLWGVLIVWAVVEMVLINAQTPRPAPFTGGSVKGDVRLLAITLVLYGIIAAIHTWLGYYPFPG
ncbi:NnrU family protein [Anianabacter salinae]|uniref:NnrU family protein n=1 Tax=Anianabacter salinae TaxID=2851023 RepID=UPI00225DF09A|nr:NnrU family protein [Anianabacter salinae]MBV0913020.1 NnrU family protein [Anianabacter salinae]